MNKQEILTSLSNEKLKTYKVKILYNLGFNKEEALNYLLSHDPKYNLGTFNTSWSALKRSKGRTPNCDLV